MTNSFNKLYKVIKTLIAPDGCPWDSVQMPENMKCYLVEETFEALEAINEKGFSCAGIWGTIVSFPGTPVC